MTALGLVAGTLTTVSFVPQVVRAVRTQSTEDLSYSWLVLLAIGICGWIAYGLLIADLAVTLSNTIVLVMILFLLSLKLKWDGLDAAMVTSSTTVCLSEEEQRL